MRKTAAAITVILLLIAAAVSAHAVTIEAGRIRPFDDNILTVTSEDGGRLTIEAVSGTIPLENPVTDLPVEGGTVEIHWNALSYNGEPLTPGSITLRALLAGNDLTTEVAEIRQKVDSPKPAVLCCLPVTQTFYANGKTVLRIECAISCKGTYELQIARKDKPDEAVWHYRTVYSGRGAPMVISWDGKGKNHKVCSPGEYIISAWAANNSEYVQTAEIALIPEPLPEPELTATGSLIPENLSDDAAVWEALMAPVAVGDGPEGKGLKIMNAKAGKECIGTVSCRTVGLAVLELYDDGWAKIGAWRQMDGAYIEGYVKTSKLRMVRPNTRYGAVVDKKKQTLTVYENGKKLGTAMVSTGFTTAEDRTADTHSGIYLLGTRMDGFGTDGHTYAYPIRMERLNLIHQMGYEMKNGERDFSAEMETLGTMASHGCVRVDARITEENNGINAWWIWTHMGHDSKIIVTPED